jgi:hypothetical protein
MEARDRILRLMAKAVCTICAHPRRHQLEIGLVHRVPLEALARRFQCSPHALHRHRHKHLSPATAAAILVAQRPCAVDLEALQRSESEGLLSQLLAQRARLAQHSELALELGNSAAAVAAERAITANLELVAKLLGQLIQHHEVRSTSILISADYLALRSTLLQALRPYPAAAKAVGAALHRLEEAAARDITGTQQPLVLTETIREGNKELVQ